MRRILLALTLVPLLPLAAWAHGGSFRGPRGGTPPGLPTQPTKPGESGGSTHSWLTWWGYNQFKYTDFRRRQAARRGPVSGSERDPTEEVDPNAWREEVRRELTPLMLEALGDPDEEVRTAAAVALGKWRAVIAIPELKTLYRKDDVRQVRESGVLGLVLMRDPSLRDFLIGLAEEKEEDAESLRVRGYALLGLGLIGDAESRGFLLGLLDPKNGEARRVLPRMDRRREEFLCAAIAALTQIDREGVDLSPEFVRISRDDRLPDDVRAWAITALGKTGAREQRELVLEVLKEAEDDQMRRSAAMALGSLATRADSDVIAELGRRLTDDSDKIVRHFSAIALGRIGGPTAYRHLVERYDRASKEDRGFLIMAYGLSKEPGAGERLAKILAEDADPLQQAAAALALGLLEDKAQVPALREAFDEAKAWTLLQTCMLALGILNDQGSADKVKEILIEKRQATVRTAAAVSYALLRQHAALPVLIDILRSARTIVTLSAISQVMGFLTSPRAVKPLVELYRDTKLQRQARAFALVAIGALGDREDFPVLIRMAFDINYMIRSDAVDEAFTIL